MKGLEKVENEKLVLLIKTGDEDALVELIHRFKPHLNRLARSYFLFGGEEEDIKQEAMIGLYSACISYKPDMKTTFNSFASLCMKRRILSAIKSANRNKNKPLNESVSIHTKIDSKNEVELYLPQYVFNPDEVFEENENYEEIKIKITKTLSNMEFKILSLFLKGLSYDEIANLLNISKKSVDNALSRIKNKLKFLIK